MKNRPPIKLLGTAMALAAIVVAIPPAHGATSRSARSTPSESTRAAVILGAGMTSALPGRLAPAAHLGFATDNWNIGFFMAGVQSRYYSHSTYFLGVYLLPVHDNLFWGDIRAGIGLAMAAALMSRTDQAGGDAPRFSDFAAGPAVKVTWQMAGPVFIGTEALFGLRSLKNFAFEFQNVTILSLGVRI